MVYLVVDSKISHVITKERNGALCIPVTAICMKNGCTAYNIFVNYVNGQICKLIENTSHYRLRVSVISYCSDQIIIPVYANKLMVTIKGFYGVKLLHPIFRYRSSICSEST